MRQSGGLLAIVAFLGIAGVVTNRAIAGLAASGADGYAWAMADFRNAVYYPVVAWLHGDNPYDATHQLATYPVDTKFPLYSPLTLLIHLPFGLLPLRAAEALYYLVILALMPVLGLVVLEAADVGRTTASVFTFAAVALASRPGQQNLLKGQVTLQVVLASYLALRWARERPWLAGLGLAISTLKPTYGAPLALLLVCRGALRATAIGITLAGASAAGVALTLVHAAGGVTPFIDSLRANWGSAMLTQWSNPALSMWRIDAVAVVARLLGRSPGTVAALGITLVIVALGGLAVRRLALRSDAERCLGAALVCLSVLTCTYHQSYDLLMLAMPLTMLALGAPSPEVSPGLRWTLCALLALPAANYLASVVVLDRFGLSHGGWVAVTSFNGAALLVALGLCAGAALAVDR